MTNEQLAQFIQQGGNDELLPLLWDKTRLIIYKKCGQIWRLYSEKLMLQQPLPEDVNGGVLYIADTVADKRSAAAYEEIERLDEYKALYEAVDSLPPNQRTAIYEYYFKGFTRKRIAEIHNCTESDVRRILHKALCSLRSGETGERLWEIYGEDYGVYSIRHKGLAAFKRSGTSEIEDYVLRRLGNTSIHKP